MNNYYGWESKFKTIKMFNYTPSTLKRKLCVGGVILVTYWLEHTIILLDNTFKRDEGINHPQAVYGFRVKSLK